MLELLLPILKNIHAGPKTTILGLVLMCASGYKIYTEMDNAVVVSIASSIFVVGFVLLFLKDWQNGQSKLDS